MSFESFYETHMYFGTPDYPWCQGLLLAHLVLHCTQARRQGGFHVAWKPPPVQVCVSSSMLRLLSGRTLTLQHEDQNGRKDRNSLSILLRK